MELFERSDASRFLNHEIISGHATVAGVTCGAEHFSNECELWDLPSCQADTITLLPNSKQGFAG
jgi:hypothetical protein